MRLLAVSLISFLLGACASHHYGFTDGPARLHLTAPPVVEADAPFDLSILIEGAMPQYEVTVELLVDGELVARGQGILPSRLLQLRGTIGRELYYEKQHVSYSDPADPRQYDANVDSSGMTDPSVELEVRLHYLDETGALRVASARRTLRLACMSCPI